MIDRAYLKEKGKSAFQRNYWPCVGVALILTWCVGSGSASYSSYNRSFNTNDYSHTSYNYDYDDDDFDFDELNDDDFDFDDYDDSSAAEEALAESMVKAMTPMLAAIVLIATLIGAVLSIFVKNPLSIGCRRYFCINSFEKPQFNEVGYAFKKGKYGNVVKVLFMKDLFVFLWSLLLVIPGIIKSYEYYLVPYILSEDPDIGYKEALEQSKRMMDGYKMDVFILELSFIGWALLSVLTCGILSIFFVTPYTYSTYAEFFLDRRNGYFGPNVQPYYIPSFAGMGGYGYNAPVPPVAPGGYNSNPMGYGNDPAPAPSKPIPFNSSSDPYGSPSMPNTSDPYGNPGMPNTSDPYGNPGMPNTSDPYGNPSSANPTDPYGSAGSGNEYYNPDSTANPGNDDTPFGI